MDDKFFDRLTAVDWNALGHPDIPKWIQNLVSNNRDLHADGYRHLEDLVAYAGSQSWENFGPISELLNTETSIYLIPFFVELLQDEKSAYKESVLQFISDLATYPELIKPTDAEIYKTRTVKVFEAVIQGIDTYKMLLSDRNVSVRDMAKEVLEQINISARHKLE